MIKNLTLLLAFVLIPLSHVYAQQTGDEIFVIDITIDGVITTYKNGYGGFSAPADWGGAIISDFCAEAVWGYDSSVPSDSLCCDTISNNYTGKAVLVRRGVCEFGRKMYNAQQSGASIAIVANGYAVTNGDANNAPSIGGGGIGPLVTIPVMLFCRNMVDVIDAAIKAGKKPMICIRRSNLHDPTGGYAYATPITQADTVDLISMGCKNRTNIGQNYKGKVTITDPVGVVTTLESTQYIEAGADSVIFFNSYVPISPKIGTYTMEFTTDLTTNVGDTMTRQFIYTQDTYATDNFVIKGGSPVDDIGIGAIPKHSVVSLYRTGDAGLNVNTVRLGIHNAASVAVADPAANVINLILYDADTDDDGVTEEGTGVGAFDALPFIAFVDYTFDASLKPDSLFSVELIPIDGSEIKLKPNHFYYLRAIYDGTSANLGKLLSFTCSGKVSYTPKDLGWAGIGPITPFTLDNLYPGWDDFTPVLRLIRTTIIVPGVKPTPLDPSKYAIYPNPAIDYTLVNLKLATPNKSVTVSVFDMQGRIVASQIVRNFQSGQIKMDTRNLASGNYGLSIRSSEEGSTMTNLMICH